MRLVDTSAWIEALDDSTELAKRLASEMPAPSNWLVPTVVQLELAKWANRELGERKAEDIIGFSTTCIIADLDSQLASAAELSTRHRLSTADAIIYATALAFGADLLTCDAHFKNLPSVRYIPKSIH